VFSKNVPAAAIAKALQSLERAGLAYAMRTATSGRPAEVWSAW
jgi:predicted ArsR family transcriptional regulator